MIDIRVNGDPDDMMSKYWWFIKVNELRSFGLDISLAMR